MTTSTLFRAGWSLAALTLVACGGDGDVPTDSNKNEAINFDARQAVEATPAPARLACPYPTTGTMGAKEGNTVPSNLTWTGYDIQSNVEGPVPVTNYFDCDGSKGYHALLFDTSRYG